MVLNNWFSDWQHKKHALNFDGRAVLNRGNLIRDYEAYSETHILLQRLHSSQPADLLEIGCATGEFYRYLCLKRPCVKYWGIDISVPAIERANEKYPHSHFMIGIPDESPQETLRRHGSPQQFEVVYSKDVVLHQLRPFDFVANLITLCTDAVVLRCRTRDKGETVLDPHVSCQRHYSGWMPYIIINIEELVAHIISCAPACEVVVYRNHMILGGQHNRFIPKDCYDSETGTAETALGIFKKTDQPGKVSFRDVKDHEPHYTLGRRLGLAMRAALREFRK